MSGEKIKGKQENEPVEQTAYVKVLGQERQDTLEAQRDGHSKFGAHDKGQVGEGIGDEGRAVGVKRILGKKST